MKLNSIKTIKPGSQFGKKLLAILLCITVIIITYIVLDGLGKEAKDKVEILRVNSKGGIPAKAAITKDNIEKSSIIRTEFSKEMITADKMDEVINKYAAYYLRDNTPLYKDQLIDEKPMKNEWLYKIKKSNEVLTLPYDYMNCGGDILTPGDYIRVRVAFNETVGGSDPNAIPGFGGGKTVRKSDVLFDRIMVKDLLNASGHSIYEVYKEVLKLDEEKKQEVMKSSQFLGNILPKSLILEATPEQIDKYAKYKDKDDKSLTITILSRENNKDIIDQLPTIEKEIESWITKKD
ncbi:MAG: flagellar biosynthesis protein FlgA [Clostridia bacterium]|nr:flagellar biosynthesis protein FlgA [Clostridia bacterium]